MLSEGNAAHPFGCDSPLLTIVVRQKAITIIICRGLSHPTRSFSRIVCRGQERPKDRGGTLRPDFQANTALDLGFFLKSQCHHKIQEDSCEEIEVKLAKRYTRMRIFLALILNFVLFHCQFCRINKIFGKEFFYWTIMGGATIIPSSLKTMRTEKKRFAKFFFFLITYDPLIFANNIFSKI